MNGISTQGGGRGTRVTYVRKGNWGRDGGGWVAMEFTSRVCTYEKVMSAGWVGY